MLGMGPTAAIGLVLGVPALYFCMQEPLGCVHIDGPHQATVSASTNTLANPITAIMKQAIEYPIRFCTKRE